MSVRADPVLLEILRSRLQSVVDEAALTIEQTAVSPVVAEGNDFSSNILDADGSLLVGGGRMEYKYAGARNVVAATIARHGGTLAPGDVFAANDPHSGGGNHPQDIEICQPVFVGDELVAWIAASAHLIDVGGMTFGSWAPNATECYQEAIRFPPVRLFRAGEEQHDIWDLILTNVRLPRLVEMDIRGLVAGCHVATRKLIAVVEAIGTATFAATAKGMCDAAEEVLRERIRRIADGRYEMDAWVEWGAERYHVPCRLDVDGSDLRFDFTGAPPQVPRFINSKHYIIRGEIVADLRNLIAQDLPFCEGLYRPIHVVCPPGTIVDSRPPAPIASAHLDVAMNATQSAIQCVQLALAATDDETLPWLPSGPSGQTALATHSWAYTTPDGMIDGWVLPDGWQPGSSAGEAHDGSDLFANLIGTQSLMKFVDVEITEAWYPLHVIAKTMTPASYGAGRHRAGAGCCMSYQVRTDEHLNGAMFAMRHTIPVSGVAGGEPGAPTGFRIRRDDGTVIDIAAQAADVSLEPGDVFEFQAGSGGGWGDPLDRAPDLVAADVREGRLLPDDATRVYGVVGATGWATVDEESTHEHRARTRAERLAAAMPAPRPVIDGESIDPDTEPIPLYHGVLRRGRLAVAALSGAILAVAPDHWTDGCAVLEERHTVRGVDWLTRTYLDPVDGRALQSEAVPPLAARSFTTMPRHWTDAGAER
jgi:N-methylhydantoinase B